MLLLGLINLALGTCGKIPCMVAVHTLRKAILLCILNGSQLLTHYILVDSSTVICWTSHFRGVESILLLLFYFRWKILIANSVDSNQTPHYVGFDLGLHCLVMTLSTGLQVRMG